MSYELELDLTESILILNYEHNRLGLEAALKQIEFLKNKLIAASIYSSKDGLIYTFN